MNILIAVTTMSRANGGVCTHILDLCRGLSNEKIVLCADGSDYTETIEQFSNVTYIDFPFSLIQHDAKKFLRTYKCLKQICKEHSIDIIHLHGQRIIPFAWMIRSTLGIPFLWTNHIDAIPHARLFQLMHKMMRFPIISVSHDLKQDLIANHGIREKYIDVICNGINLDLFSPLSKSEIEQLRSRFNISSSEYVISQVSRLTYGKGQDLLIRAVKKISEKYPQKKFHVLFAGSGDESWFQANVADYALENGIKYSFLGFQSPRDVFGVSNLSVLPSLYEGFGLVCLESLAMCCPVIRSDSPGHSDMRDISLVHQKGNLQQLFECIDYALCNDMRCNELAKLGRMRCETIFNVQEMSNRTLLVYRRVLRV